MACPVCGNGSQSWWLAGIWFHRYELMRVDESHESARESPLNIERDRNLPAVRTKRLRGLKGDDAVIARHFLSAKRRVTGDDCTEVRRPPARPRRAGHHPCRVRLGIRQGEAVKRYLSALVDPRLAAEHARSEEELAHASRFAHTLRFFCPSY